MKKLGIVLSAICMMGTLPVSAQFGKLLDKVKGKPKTETTTESGVTKTEEPKKKKQRKGEFKSVWESEFDNKATILAVTNDDGSVIVGTDDNSASVIDGSGKAIWNGDYKKITTNKTNNCEFQYVVWKEGGGYLFLFDSRSMGTDRIACLDVMTGKEMWNSEKYQNLISKETSQGDIETVKYIAELDAFLISQKEAIILVKAKTGEKIWENNRFKGGVGKYIYDAKRNEIVMLNFKPTSFGALFAGFKNQLVKINAANGDVAWDATFVGAVEKEYITRKFMVDLAIKGDKLFLYLNGLQVYNIDNGQKLWEATYENDLEGAGGFLGNKDQKIYKTLADPLFEGNAVYITMFGNRDRTKYIEKHDLESGKLLWATEKIKGSLCIPHIYKAGNKLMVQIGGKVQVQGHRMETVATMSGTAKVEVSFVEWQYKDQKNAVAAIDDATGTIAWRSEKFDKRITDLILEGDKTVFVGDGDEFYSYDIPTGKQLYDVKHTDAKVGKAKDVIDYEDRVVVLSEKGLAAYNKKDGSLAYALKGGGDSWYKIGENYFFQTVDGGTNHYNVYDLDAGVFKGTIYSKGKGGSPEYGNGIDITDDGEYIFAFKGKKVEKVKVNN